MKSDTQVGGDHYSEWIRYSHDGKLFWNKTSSSKAVAGSEAGWMDKDGYIVVTIRGKKLRAARLVMMIHGVDVPKRMHVDHINGNITDNRIENLRIATPSQNSCNRRTQINNTTGAKGCVKAGKKYQAQIQVAGRYVYLGRFNTLNEAKAAYSLARTYLHGEFSNGD